MFDLLYNLTKFTYLATLLVSTQLRAYAVNHQYSVPTIYQRVSRTSILNKVLIF